MGQTLEIVINSYQSRTESVYLAMVKNSYKLDLSAFTVVLCKHLLDFMLVSFRL